MGHNHTPVEIDQQTLEHSHKLWSNFTCAAKYGIIAVAIVLLLMGFFLVD